RAEPREDRLVLAIEVHLARTEAAVHAFLAVRVGERAGELDGQIDRVRDRHPGGGQALLERVVADRRRDDEGRQPVGLRAGQVENVAVRQHRRAADVLVVAGRVLRQRRIEYFDDHHLVEQLVARTEAARELAFADRSLERVDRREVEFRYALETRNRLRSRDR